MRSLPVAWHGSAAVVLSAVAVFLAVGLAGRLLPGAWLGVMAAACAWFFGWGLLGSLIGFELQRLGAVYGFTLQAMAETASMAAIGMGVLLWLLREWGITASESRSLVGLANLAQVIALALLARQAGWFVLDMVLNPKFIPEFTNNPWPYVWERLSLNLEALAVALILLRFVTPFLSRSGLVPRTAGA
jgi:hypothetical protein